jgi:hypothetical protein
MSSIRAAGSAGALGRSEKNNPRTRLGVAEKDRPLLDAGALQAEVMSRRS